MTGRAARPRQGRRDPGLRAPGRRRREPGPIRRGRGPSPPARAAAPAGRHGGGDGRRRRASTRSGSSPWTSRAGGGRSRRAIEPAAGVAVRDHSRPGDPQGGSHELARPEGDGARRRADRAHGDRPRGGASRGRGRGAPDALGAHRARGRQAVRSGGRAGDRSAAGVRGGDSARSRRTTPRGCAGKAAGEAARRGGPRDPAPAPAPGRPRGRLHRRGGRGGRGGGGPAGEPRPPDPPRRVGGADGGRARPVPVRGPRGPAGGGGPSRRDDGGVRVLRRRRGRRPDGLGRRSARVPPAVRARRLQPDRADGVGASRSRAARWRPAARPSRRSWSTGSTSACTFTTSRASPSPTSPGPRSWGRSCMRCFAASRWIPSRHPRGTVVTAATPEGAGGPRDGRPRDGAGDTRHLMCMLRMRNIGATRHAVTVKRFGSLRDRSGRGLARIRYAAIPSI